MHIIVHPTGRNSFEFSVPLKLRRAYIVLHLIRYAQIQFPPKRRRVYPKRLERVRLTGCIWPRMGTSLRLALVLSLALPDGPGLCMATVNNNQAKAGPHTSVLLLMADDMRPVS